MGPKVCSYIYWAKTKSDIPMVFDDTENGKAVEQICSMVVDAKLFAKQSASDYMSLLTGYKFVFDYLVPRLKSEISGSNCKQPKFTHFSTHQEFLGPFLQVLGYDKFKYTRVEPTSSLFIELYERCKSEDQKIDRCDKTQFVKIIFMSDSETIDVRKEMSMQELLAYFENKYSKFLESIKRANGGQDGLINSSTVCETKFEDVSGDIEYISGANFVKNLAKQHELGYLYKLFSEKFKELSKKFQKDMVHDEL